MKKISIFIPRWADEGNTNAQNLTVRQIMARLDPDRFHFTTLLIDKTDLLLRNNANISYFKWTKHFNTLRFLPYLLKLQPDIFFFPDRYWFELEFILLRLLKLIKTKLVTYIVYEINDNHRSSHHLPDKIQRNLMTSATTLVSNSDHVARGIKRVYHLDTPVIFDGIDERYFFASSCEDALSNRPLAVLYAGSFQQRKRPERIVELAAKYPQYLFRLAGEGPLKQACEQLAKTLSCTNVIFLGLLPQAELGKMMRASDIFLFPSVGEGHPQVLGQAAACGLPSVAMKCYHPNYVKHGETGFLAENDDEWEAYFDLIANNRALRLDFSQKAVKHAALFDWDQIAASWSDLFIQVHDK